MGDMIHTENRKLSEKMAEEYGLTREQFIDAVKKRVFKAQAATITNAEFMTFLVISDRYNLDPFTGEIHAFKGKGGGVLPVVGIDGWAGIVNRHPLFSRVEFTEHHDDNGKLTACTAHIYKKGATEPSSVTEYFSECFRATDPWKSMPHRMLRHKAFMQCARYALGIRGIMDVDEAKSIAVEVEDAPSESPDIESVRAEIEAKFSDEPEDALPVVGPEGVETEGDAV